MLQLKEVARPVPADDEILVKVHAVSVNRSDWEGLVGKAQTMSSKVVITVS